ncbi:alpha/beta fold hydrolase [Paenibacillus alvei]|uniref:alpha/beta hydrolase family protein n=1 Tax=Paenibacillus alvei TaxID=44250 RepID=UPI00038632D8|nr:alpha/beta fold hydrolase [Paenibacillus alvei]EPY12631.1 putative hydrolase [Paenibacillus alvei A6-6i-x]
MNKSAWKWMMAACLLLGSAVPTAFAEETKQEAASEKKETASMVQLRQAANAIGAYVKWDQSTKEATVTYGDRVWIVRSGSVESTISGQPLKLTAAPRVEQGTLVVPWNDLCEALHIQAKWVNGKVEAETSDWKTRASQFVMQFAAAADRPEAVEQIQSSLTPALKKAGHVYPIGMFAKQITTMFGHPTQLIQVTQTENDVHRNAAVSFKTDKGSVLSVVLRYAKDGLVDDMYFNFVPQGQYQAPSYDDKDAYREESIVIGEGEFKLPGTLTVPASGDGNYPVLVLVHGSGANDRDESIGSSKMFRDLSVGLAKQGIATIRYEKRTREYSYQSTAVPRFTVKEETIDDALHAVAWAAQDKRLNKQQIFVLGHSQGGMLVPRILAQDTAKAIRGAVVAAGPSGPLEDLMLTQFEGQLARAKESKLPEQAIAQLEAQVAAWKQSLQIIKNKEYTVDNYPANLPIGTPSWWFDFRDYYGGDIAKTQQVPMFLIQGDNDVQVGKEHLDGWKKALSSRTNVAYKLYPKLNHVFVPYDKPSTGEEYMLPGNVPLEVITDMAKWIKTQS